MIVEIKKSSELMFKPYSVTFHIKTEREAILLHDKVLIKMGNVDDNGRGQLIGDVYMSTEGKPVEDKSYLL